MTESDDEFLTDWPPICHTCVGAGRITDVFIEEHHAVGGEILRVPRSSSVRCPTCDGIGRIVDGMRRYD